MLSNEEYSEWLHRLSRGPITSLLLEASSNRALDIVATVFLLHVASSIYASSRTLGKTPDQSLEESIEELCSIHHAAIELITSSYNEGELEEEYQKIRATIPRKQ